MPLKSSRCAGNERDTDLEAIDGRSFLFHLSFLPYLSLIVAILISSLVCAIHLTRCLFTELSTDCVGLRKSKTDNHSNVPYKLLLLFRSAALKVSDANNHGYKWWAAPMPPPRKWYIL